MPIELEGIVLQTEGNSFFHYSRQWQNQTARLLLCLVVIICPAVLLTNTVFLQKLESIKLRRCLWIAWWNLNAKAFLFPNSLKVQRVVWFLWKMNHSVVPQDSPKRAAGPLLSISNPWVQLEASVIKKAPWQGRRRHLSLLRRISLISLNETWRNDAWNAWDMWLFTFQCRFDDVFQQRFPLMSRRPRESRRMQRPTFPFQKRCQICDQFFSYIIVLLTVYMFFNFF